MNKDMILCSCGGIMPKTVAICYHCELEQIRLEKESGLEVAFEKYQEKLIDDFYNGRM